MFILPTSLLLLSALQVFAIPIDRSSCTPTRLTLILGPTYLNSPPIHNYCTHHLFTPSSSPHPSLPLEVSPSASASDVHAACECLAALPPMPDNNNNAPQGGGGGVGGFFGQQQQQQQKVSSPSLASLFPQGLVQKAVPQPYGRGALPAPLGSELKGFGARDNLYVRGGIVDGVNNRGA